MMGRIRLTPHKHHIILHSSHLISIKTSISLSMHHNNHMRSRITITRNINRISTPHINHTLKEGVAENSEAEEEEGFVEEEVRLHAITVDKQVTVPEISWNLWRHVHTVMDMTIMWSNAVS